MSGTVTRPNDVLGMVIGFLAIVFIFFMARSFLTGAAKKVKPDAERLWSNVNGVPAPNLELGQTTGTTTTDTTTSGYTKCGTSATRNLLNKNVTVPSGNSYGQVSGAVYGVLNCEGSRVVDAYTDPVAVGLFVKKTSGDFANGLLKSNDNPIQMTACSSSIPTCYQFANVGPGEYSVLVQHHGGWYCDSGSCRATVKNGYTTILDFATNN